MTTLAYHNDPKLKTKFVNLMIRDRRQDRFVRGKWAQPDATDDDFRGCHIGCLGHHCGAGLGSDGEERIRLISSTLGIPESILWMNERIFEASAFPVEKARVLSESVLDAIPVGADLSMVVPRMMLWLFSGDDSPMREAAGHESVRGVADLYSEWIETGVRPERERWLLAAWAARALWARAAARVSGAAWAADAAWSLVAAAEWAARDPQSVWEAIARRLLHELSRAPVPGGTPEPERTLEVREVDVIPVNS